MGGGLGKGKCRNGRKDGEKETGGRVRRTSAQGRKEIPAQRRGGQAGS